ncbi:ribosome-associated protein [Tenacibaculum sp. MAR_2010_89]|uniref:alternative ribosome rescue aminoacyl-tRNA hydrolase ArfB n=1 Tax=Tenacibaculum sp. MAR_2010_89 TaxID=1250198 RepID=UPI00089B93E5|nr:alternative ribosome rescue aminoacyl-tRNA hydrolase ArfB [Tenacibaculum sp. MAR_2010_89]SEE12436.1 ribosome-associated protein [Tenacibaculum sp. MAR_2010_89]
MNIAELFRELTFKATRSSGAGGQHVNKVSSKIELSFDIKNSIGLSSREKELLSKNLAHRLTKNHFLILFCDDTRSQHRNKELAIKRFIELIKLNLIRPKSRRPTKPTKNSIKKRVETKKKNSLKKALRKKPKI